MERILMNVRRSVMVFTMLMMAMVTFAVPAKPGLTRMLTLSDGRTVSAVLVGDEHGHFWRGADGKSYHLIAGTDTYQEVDGQEIMQKAKQRRAQTNQRRMKRMAPQKIGSVGSITGDKKGLIILVNFADKSFSATQNDFYKLANQANYNSGNYKGSMYDYFYAQSDGQFRLTFDVVGPYTVSQNCAYYGGNDSEGNDEHPAEMVIEALKLANGDVNYANYDWDGDGTVEQVYVVYAGKGEADGGAASTIWPHEYDLNSANYFGDGAGRQRLDGVYINTYACGGEQNGSTGETAGIGTMCHEFSHCLGYPDFYDTDYSGGQGMFQWDLMDSGSYNGDGYQPAGYTSYERWVAGWKEPIELVNTQQVSNMAALQTTGSNSYIIYNKGNRNEYYLLENRQKTGWDTSLPGKGLLILHVDYNATAWANNKPNDDPSHQRMTWVAADNQYQYTTYQGSKYYTEAGAKNDPFPYGSVNAFGKNTTPAATLYNNNSDGTKYLDSSVENITQNSDGTISFLFRGLSNVEAPTFSPNGGSFDYGSSVNVTITCGTSGASIYYTTDGSVPTTTSTRYTGALTFNTYTVLKAIAVKDGESSGVTEATYSFNEPTIVTEESLKFSTYVGSPQTLQLEVLTENLTQNVTLTLTDANGVFSLSSTSIAKDVEDATVDVTFNPQTVGNYTGTITLTSQGAETVTVSLTATATEAPATNPNTKTFKLVNSASEMVSGMRYIIACGSESKAAGALSSQLLTPVDVTFNSDNVTDITGKSVVVYVVEGSQSAGWTFKNESNNKYLYATTTKKLAESTAKNTWTLSGNETGVLMTYGDYGTMLYNVSNPRFTTYTSAPSATMIQAHLYVEYSGGSASTSGTPVIAADSELSFSATVGDSQINSFDVLAEDLTEDITVTLIDENNVFSIGSSTISKSAAEAGAAVNVTFTPTSAGTFTGTIILSSEGAENETVTLTGTAVTAATSTTTEELIDFSAQGYSDGTTMSTVTGSACTVNFSKGTNTNDPKYYTNGTAIRMYGGNTMTIASDKTIVKIEITFGSGDGSNSISTNVVTYSNGTWTGSANSVTFTIGGTSGHRRIQTVKITYADNGSGGNDNPGTDTEVSDYYAKAKGKKGSALKTAMCGIIYNRTEKSYDYLWTAFQTTDVRPSGGANAGKIWDMYSNITNYTPVTSGSTYSKEGDCYNREHSWPQSWFGSNAPMNTDLHHIYPTDGFVNSKRANYPFGEVANPTYSSANGFSKLGPCSYTGYTGTVFEPADEYKGDFARTYFYMVTCYEEKLHDWYTNYSNTDVDNVIDGSTYPALQTWQLQMLMKWSKNDPISEKEIARNKAVYAIQKNRNPFIDFPGLEEYIWGTMTNTTFSNDNYVTPSGKENVTMVFSPTSATATIGEDFTEPVLTINPAGLTVAYSSSNTDVATVNTSTGEVSLIAAGTTTVTATFAGNDSYNSGSASYILTVSESASVTVPTLAVSNVTENSADASWDACTGVTSYTLQLASDDQFTTGSTATTILSEDFTGVTTTETAAISNFNSCFKASGWNGENVYPNSGCVRLGKSSGAGSLQTPALSASGTVTVTWKAYQWSGDETSIYVGVSEDSGTSFVEKEVTLTDNLTSYSKSFTITGSSVIVRWRSSANSKQRFYLDDIAISSNGSGTGSIIAEETVSGTNYTFTGLEPETTYYARVKGNGEWSNVVTFTTEAETISKTDPTITVADAEVPFGSTFTLNANQITGGPVIVTSSNTAVATVEDLVITPVAVGTTTITVSTAADDNYNAGEATFVLTVTAPEGLVDADIASGTVFSETFSGCTGTGGNDGSWSGTIAQGALVAGTNSDMTGWTFTNGSGANACAKFGATSKQGSATTPAIGKAGTLNLSFRAGAWNISAEGTTLNLSVSPGKIDKESVTLTKGAFNTYTATITDATADTKITFEAANASNNRFFLDDVVVSKPSTILTATLNASGYATYCSLYPLDFTDAEANGYSAWQVKGVNGENLTFEKITGSIKGGQGILLKGTPNATVTLASANSNNVLTGNQLYGTTAPTYVAENAFYGLSGQSFVKVNSGTVKAGKALLPASIVDAADGTRLSFVFEDDNTTTGISEERRVKNEESVYNLNGQRVVNPKKGGLYIVGGKKVIVK